MYPAKQLVEYTSEDIYRAQINEDEGNRQYLKDNFSRAPFLNEHEKQLIVEYFTETMEKYRLIYNAFIKAFSNGYVPGYPKNIYGIDLSDGAIDTDKAGRRVSYSPKVLAPCSSTAAQFIDANCGKVYAIFPPIKSGERTLEKIINERLRELKKFKKDKLEEATSTASDINIETDIVHFNIPKDATQPITLKPTVTKNALSQKADAQHQFIAKNFITDIAKENILPKDIYRLSILAKHRSHLRFLIEKFKKQFPEYIKFENEENNQYKKHVSQRKRGYIDIKLYAHITIPGTHRSFCVEFQFKQTNMFYAHIRSHRAYEDYRVLDAKYQKLKESAEQKGTLATQKIKTDLASLAKKRDEKFDLCEKIHKSSLHQSNFYVMQEITWMDDSARGMGHQPNADGHYDASVQFLKDNYTIENYELFDGLTAFATNEKEHLNKSYFLKLIGKLPENFDELGKNAPEHIKKIWSTLEAGDIDKFKNITNTAIRYQSIIRDMQKRRQKEENGSIQKTILENAIMGAKQNAS